MDDRELAHRLAENDDAALEALVNGHYQAIYRFLWRLVGSDEQARDLTQDALLQIRSSAQAFRGRSAFRTWALTIAYRTFAKSRRRRTGASLTEANLVPGGPSASLDRIAFEQALLRLTPKLKDAFTLHALHELSVSETASILGVPEGTAKSRIARARKILQTHLEMEPPNHVAIETR